MEEKEVDLDKLMICPKCKAVNRNERYCHNCGRDLLSNEPIEDESEENKIEYIDSSNSSNVVAGKFELVVLIIKFIGYISALIIVIAFLIMAISFEKGHLFLIGIILGIIQAIITWLSTLILEAIAEALNLLQDIKNKL